MDVCDEDDAATWGGTMLVGPTAPLEGTPGEPYGLSHCPLIYSRLAGKGQGIACCRVVDGLWVAMGVRADW